MGNYVTLANLSVKVADKAELYLTATAKEKEIACAIEVKDEAEAIAKSLGRDGRIVLRPSGTEPVLRVMVEAQSEAECREYIDRMVRAIREVEGK